MYSPELMEGKHHHRPEKNIDGCFYPASYWGEGESMGEGDTMVGTDGGRSGRGTELPDSDGC